MDQRIKLVIVGDGACGKTSLLFAHTDNAFLDDYIPTVFDNYVSDVQIGTKKVELSLWDTAGQEDYDRLRSISYSDTDVLLVCYAIDDEGSYLNIPERWAPEVHHFCPGVPVILVGCKKDMRLDDESRSPDKLFVSEKFGQAMCKRIQADGFIETSAKTREGVKEVIELAVKKAVEKIENDRRKRRRNWWKCCVSKEAF